MELTPFSSFPQLLVTTTVQPRSLERSASDEVAGIDGKKRGPSNPVPAFISGKSTKAKFLEKLGEVAKFSDKFPKN